MIEVGVVGVGDRIDCRVVGVLNRRVYAATAENFGEEVLYLESDCEGLSVGDVVRATVGVISDTPVPKYKVGQAVMVVIGERAKDGFEVSLCEGGIAGFLHTGSHYDIGQTVSAMMMVNFGRRLLVSDCSIGMPQDELQASADDFRVWLFHSEEEVLTSVYLEQWKVEGDRKRLLRRFET